MGDDSTKARLRAAALDAIRKLEAWVTATDRQRRAQLSLELLAAGRRWMALRERERVDLDAFEEPTEPRRNTLTQFPEVTAGASLAAARVRCSNCGTESNTPLADEWVTLPVVVCASCRRTRKTS